MNTIKFLSFVLVLSLGSSACGMHRLFTRFKPQEAGWNTINTAYTVVSVATSIGSGILMVRLNKLAESAIEERLAKLEKDSSRSVYD